MSDLKFNPSRHDQRIAAQQSEKAKAKALKAAGTIYQDWKRRLLKDKKATTSTIADAVLDLRTAIHKHFSTEPELTEWTAFTLKMLDDKLGVLTTLDITAENRIIRYIPMLEDPDGNLDRLAKPESTVFRAEDQLRAIPFVRLITEQPGFIGFVLDASILVAMFDDGEIMPVGAVLNGVGLEKIPGLEDYRQALLATQAASDASATSGEPETPAAQLPKPATNGHPAKSPAKTTSKARRPRF